MGWIFGRGQMGDTGTRHADGVHGARRGTIICGLYAAFNGVFFGAFGNTLRGILAPTFTGDRLFIENGNGPFVGAGWIRGGRLSDAQLFINAIPFRDAHYPIGNCRHAVLAEGQGGIAPKVGCFAGVYVIGAPSAPVVT